MRVWDVPNESCARIIKVGVAICAYLLLTSYYRGIKGA